MTTRNRADRTAIRAARVAASSLLALSALGAGVGSTLAAGNSGSIWTTNDPCTSLGATNSNEYVAGETIYVRGSGFTASTAFGWTVTGNPGGASGDPGVVVASGASSTDAAGSFCAFAYTVAADDWGVYSVDVTQGKVKKNDNYHVSGPAVVTEPAVDPTPEPTPEVTLEPTPEVTPEPAVEPTPEATLK